MVRRCMPELSILIPAHTDILRTLHAGEELVGFPFGPSRYRWVASSNWSHETVLWVRMPTNISEEARASPV